MTQKNAKIFIQKKSTHLAMNAFSQNFKSDYSITSFVLDTFSSLTNFTK